MIEFMDNIVEAAEEFGKAGVEFAYWLVVELAKGIVIITAPVWILPYVLGRSILRNNNGGKCEEPDCKNCTFPPCGERNGKND